MLANRVICLSMMATFVAALLPRPASAEPFCVDYGAWPDVGGSRVCTMTDGNVCTFTSEEWGVSKTCLRPY